VLNRSNGDMSAPFTVAVVGAGGAGFEMALALQHRLLRTFAGRKIDVQLLTDNDHALTGRAIQAQRMAAKTLAMHGVQLVTDISVTAIDGNTIHAVQYGQPLQLQADLIVWAAGAQAKQWPQDGGLASDARGFVSVDASLRSTSHANVFAVGDCAALPTSLPKAGVYAVKQGPVLAANLAAAIAGTPLQTYVPQTRALALFATGSRHAIASYGPYAFSGGWVWRWKDRIDRRFLAAHSGRA
jgi:NADH dehydrogenase FAD-containing subunit